ncbi:unnamed protein product [Allacma fusca]|uniref:EamA domain-containing protein n=1 Tax=Allacma fusca TaxID=39272 RepID=A0A8J2LHU6_9HEXA|nr:unnamed protein product [Allacma fusca]
MAASHPIPINASFEKEFDSNFNSTTSLYQDGKSEKFGIDNPALEKDLEGGQAQKPENSKTKEGEKSEGKDEKSFLRQYGGMTLTLAASLLFSLVILLVKMLQPYGFSADDSSFWRYAGITLPSIPILMYFECCRGTSKNEKKNGSVFDTVWPLNKNDNWKNVVGLLARGILGGSSVILRYFAVEHMTIGDASVISYSSPVLVTILAHFFLGEKTGLVPILTAVFTLCGVVVITQPPMLTGKEGFDHDTLIGTGFAVGSLVCSACMTIITRKIREVQFALMLVVFGIIGMIQAFVISRFSNGFTWPTETYDSMMLFGVAGLSFLGQMSIILALKFEQAGPVSLIRTCDVVFGFILQFIVLGVKPNTWSAIGGSVVFAGVVITALRKWISTLPKESGCRRFFCWILF